MIKHKKKIHRINLLIASKNLYNKLNKEYNIAKGKMTIYHGNVYSSNNCEMHTLFKPEYIFYDLIESNIDSITSDSLTNINVCCDLIESNIDSITSDSLTNINVCCDKGKISEICLNESWRNSPIEWNFELVSKE